MPQRREPTGGGVRLGERSLAKMSSQQKIDLCRREIGFVFQTFNLLPRYTALENVMLPLATVKAPRRQKRAMAREALAATARLNGAGDNETGFLSPLQQVVDTEETPAERKLKLYHGAWQESVDPIFFECSY